MTKAPLKKIAVVGVPGQWSTEALANALGARTGFRLVIDIQDVMLDLQSSELWHNQTNLCELDGIAVKKIGSEYSPLALDRLQLLRIAQARGVRVFSKPEHTISLINRLSCTATLRANNIPMPATVITESVEQAEKTVERFGASVFKPLYSTKARGMQVINRTDNDKSSAITRFASHNPCMYIQQKLDLKGRDLGLIFLGGRYLGSYARVGANDSWNTTIHSGGRYANADPTAELIELAQRAQAPFGMDFTTVDIAETDDGPVVFEVSAFGGFRGAREGIGIDAAALYADYILATLSG